MIDTKKMGRAKMGRPRNFDTEEALKQAMTVFWEKGYEGASLRDLTGAMGITGPSLYAAFGDKRALYLKAIDHYMADDDCTPVQAFETEENIETALRAFLTAVIRVATRHESGAKGCFIATSVIASVDQVEGVAERVVSVIDTSEERLTARFQREIEKGTLPEDFPARERAALLFDIRQGYMFRARAGWDRTALLRDVDARVKLLLSH